PPLAATYEHAEPGVHHSRAVLLRHARHLHHVLARARRLAELEALLDEAARRLDALDLVELLDPALHLRRLRRLRAEALDEAHLLGEHRLLPLVLRLSPRRLDGARLLVEVVVAREAPH